MGDKMADKNEKVTPAPEPSKAAGIYVTKHHIVYGAQRTELKPGELVELTKEEAEHFLKCEAVAPAK